MVHKDIPGLVAADCELGEKQSTVNLTGAGNVNIEELLEAADHRM